jgi:hypothetical protein
MNLPLTFDLTEVYRQDGMNFKVSGVLENSIGPRTSAVSRVLSATRLVVSVFSSSNTTERLKPLETIPSETRAAGYAKC